jgi:hypothetical protein
LQRAGFDHGGEHSPAGEVGESGEECGHWEHGW